MNYKTIRHILSWVLKIEALCMVLPLICAFVYGESENVVPWLVCIALCVLFGFLLSIKTSGDRNMFAKEGFVSVALSWIVISFFGSIPFVLTNAIPGFVDAMFETVSGFTTTGASVISDIEALPKSVLFWRSFTHWIGGMGVLVFLVALLPLSGSGNLHLLRAESTGPSVSKLVPKVKQTAKILYLIYISMTLILIFLLWFGDMNFFEAVTHGFGTAGTGGFGIKNDSLAGYSAYSQVVITVFMILFGIDFSIYHLIILGRFRDVLKSEEWKVYIGVIILSVAMICVNCYNLFDNISDAINHSSFQVASIITTTGFSTLNFDLWPEFSKCILVILMFLGACAGSTGGGIKISRIIILVKSIAKEIKIMAHPKTTLKIKMNGRVVEHETVRSVNVFMVAYLIIFMLSILLISLDGMGFETNFTSVAATINNIGPGLADVGPASNFSCFSPFSTIILIIDMLIGRLEVFPLLLLISPYTWKK
ncbi:MAG: TrkH family potassium uptake protein [Clostridia bacterium]|nr:TrkH family potassium uptake protein [Clostridia bacterium]